jgi:hypothetical protein
MLLVFPLCFRKIQFFLCGWESFSIHSLGQFIGAESSWFSVRVAREFIPGPLEQTRANAFIFLLLFSRSQCCRRRSGTGLGTRPGQDFHSCFELTGWALRSIFGFGAGFKFLILVPCSNTLLANILFFLFRGLVLLGEHITGDSVFLWFRACPVSKKCNFSVCFFFVVVKSKFAFGSAGQCDHNIFLLPNHRVLVFTVRFISRSEAQRLLFPAGLQLFSLGSVFTLSLVCARSDRP